MQLVYSTAPADWAIRVGVYLRLCIQRNGLELTKKRSRRYPAKTITDADYADDIALLANTPNQAKTLLHSLERAAACIGLHVNALKTEYMCYNDISTLDGTSLKLVDKFTYLGSSVSSTEKYIDTRLTKAWTTIDKLSIIWKSDLTDKMKRSFFLAAVVSILLYGCTTWTLTKRLKKKLDGNYTRMLGAILNKSWWQHPIRHHLYGHLPPIRKTIQVRRTRHAGHCWRSKDELTSDVLLWTPAYGQAKAGGPARTYIQQLCEDTGCSPEDRPKAMNDREKWRERVRDIRASGTTWWGWMIGDYDGTVGRFPYSDRSDLKRTPKFVAEIQAMIDNDPRTLRTTDDLLCPPHNIRIMMKTKNLDHIVVFRVVTDDGNIMPPFVFLHGLRLITEVSIKCLKEVV